MPTTRVRGHWRKNPKTGKPVWVTEHQRTVKDSLRGKTKNVSVKAATYNMLRIGAQRMAENFADEAKNIIPGTKDANKMKRYLRGKADFYMTLNTNAKKFTGDPAGYIDQLKTIKLPEKMDADFRRGWMEERNRFIKKFEEGRYASASTNMLDASTRLYFDAQLERFDRAMKKHPNRKSFYLGFKNAYKRAKVEALGGKMFKNPNDVLSAIGDIHLDVKQDKNYNEGWRQGLLLFLDDMTSSSVF